MKRLTLTVSGIALLTMALAAQQPAAPAAQGPPPRDPSWAFQTVQQQLPPEPATPKKLEGSSKAYTPAEIDNLLAPPDWFPDQHPAAPSIVVKGHEGALACGSCHLMTGSGHPESADVSGFTADYIVQQLNDFKNQKRIDTARMNAISKELSDQEIRQAAEYFAGLKARAWTKVVEQARVPETFVGNGRMRFVKPGGAMEPIGNRIITVPDDQDRVRSRDPRIGFTAYVPPGSIAKGKALAENGGGRTIACATCHGDGMHGLGNVPRLAGLHPIYIARQLYLFREGTRNGPDAQLMKKPVAKLTDADILNLSAYLASLSPVQRGS